MWALENKFIYGGKHVKKNGVNCLNVLYVYLGENRWKPMEM